MAGHLWALSPGGERVDDIDQAGGRATIQALLPGQDQADESASSRGAGPTGRRLGTNDHGAVDQAAVGRGRGAEGRGGLRTFARKGRATVSNGQSVTVPTTMAL